METIYDKTGKEVKVGDTIQISNSRNSYNQKAIVFLRDDGELGYKLLTGSEKGKIGTLDMWQSAIWRANDTPENWIKIIKKGGLNSSQP
jgi:hypothetical protein